MRSPHLRFYGLDEAHPCCEQGRKLKDRHVQFFRFQRAATASNALRLLQAEQRKPLTLQMSHGVPARGQIEFALETPAVSINGLVGEVHRLSHWLLDALRPGKFPPSMPSGSRRREDCAYPAP
ncbi:hypothetical protein D9M71_592000 [compost metagenome]